MKDKNGRILEDNDYVEISKENSIYRSDSIYQIKRNKYDSSVFEFEGVNDWIYGERFQITDEMLAICAFKKFECK